MINAKYIVLRRDGTLPPWPLFVLSLGDAAAEPALRAYIEHCQTQDYDPDYLEFLRMLEEEGLSYRTETPVRERPDGMQPDRETHPLVAALLETGDLSQALAAALPGMVRQKAAYVVEGLARRLVTGILLRP